jgi:hypothetical protein
MKTFFTAVICLLSLTMHGQRFMIGMQGGVMFNGAPMGLGKYFTNFKSYPAMVAGGRVGVDMRKLQLGLACDVSSMRHTRDQKTIGGFPALFSYEYTSRFVSPYAFLNWKKNFVRSFIYAGVSAGVSLIKDGKDEVSFLSLPGVSKSTLSATGFSGGVQAGARIKLFDGFGAYAEAAARYSTAAPAMEVFDLNGKTLGTYESSGMLMFPVTVGVNYIF